MTTRQTAYCLTNRASSPSERGAALVTAIFGLLLITLLGLALTSLGRIALTISTNNQQTVEAFYIADSGIAHAVWLLKQVPPKHLGAWVLKAKGDEKEGTGDELSTLKQNLPSLADQDLIPAATAGGKPFGEGSYTVFVRDDIDSDTSEGVDTNQRVIATAIGTGRDGAAATVEAEIEVAAAPALLVNGKLRINGNPRLVGVGGSVHANDILDFDGTPCASQYFSSTSNVVDPSKANSSGDCPYPSGNVRPFAPAIPLPTYNMSDLRPLADYRLGADGKVYNGGGTLIHNSASTGNEWKNGSDKWKWEAGSNQKWVLDTDTLSDGTYFSDVNMQIPKNPGLSGTTPRVTLLAVGYIQVNGNPRLEANLTYQDIPLSMIAGMDIEINGNPDNGVNYQGRIWAGHQIKFSGNPLIQGQVIAANLADTPGAGPGVSLNLVPLLSGSFMEVSGNANITFDGDWNPTVRVRTWREIRN